MMRRRPGIQRALDYGALVLVAVMPTQVGVPVLKLHRAVVTLTVADILIWLLAAALVLSWLISRRHERLDWPPLHMWLIAAVAGVSATAWLYPSAPRTELLTTLKEVLQYVGLFVAAPLVLLNLLRDPGMRTRALWVWGIVTVLVVLLGATQGYLEAVGVAPEWLSATRHREQPPMPRDPGDVVGLFGSRTVYGVYLALSLPVLLALSVEMKRRVPRVLLCIAIILGAASITAPGPFLALAVGLIVTLAAMADTPKGRAAGVAIGCGIALCGLAFGPFRSEKLGWSMTEVEEVTETVGIGTGSESEGGFAPAPPDEELEVAPGESEGGQAPSGGIPMGEQTSFVVVGERPILAGRYAEWGAALDMLGSRDRPIATIGVGPGHYQSDIGGYFGVLPKGGKLEPDFQNQYLVVATELGLTGLFALALLLWRSLRDAWGSLSGVVSGVPDAMPGLAGAMVALLIANLFGGTLVRGTGVTIMLIVSLIALHGRTDRR